MQRFAFKLLVAILTLFVPAISMAQDDVGSQMLNGAGVGVSSNTADQAFGVSLPIQLTPGFRLEPTILLGIDSGVGQTDTTSLENLGGQSVRVSSTLLRTGSTIGFLGVFGTDEGGMLLGADVGAMITSQNTTTTVVQIPSGDTSERSEFSYIGATVVVRPVFGAEVSVLENVYVGLRGGPSFEIFVPDGDADSSFSLRGYGRLDVVYDF